MRGDSFYLGARCVRFWAQPAALPATSAIRSAANWVPFRERMIAA